jgi:hypothetical protein
MSAFPYPCPSGWAPSVLSMEDHFYVCGKLIRPMEFDQDQLQLQKRIDQVRSKLKRHAKTTSDGKHCKDCCCMIRPAYCEHCDELIPCNNIYGYLRSQPTIELYNSYPNEEWPPKKVNLTFWQYIMGITHLDRGRYEPEPRPYRKGLLQMAWCPLSLAKWAPEYDYAENGIFSCWSCCPRDEWCDRAYPPKAKPKAPFRRLANISKPY